MDLELELDMQVPWATASVAIMKPGDNLIISFNHALSTEEIEQMAVHIKETLPGIGKIVFIDQCSGMLVYRSEEKESDGN